jgi:hypothetical protein
MFEEAVLRTLFGYRKQDETGERRTLHNKDFIMFTFHRNRVTISRMMSSAGNVARIEKTNNTYSILVKNLKENNRDTMA